MPKDDQYGQVPIRERGNFYEDFEPGRKFIHHWGRTITSSDNICFSTSTLSYNPIYFNIEAAKSAGHPDMVVNPMLAFAVVFGLSVEDLSERGGAFLGIDDLEFLKPVYAGDTLYSRSTVLSRRESRSDPAYGIVSWLTEGYDQSGQEVLSFKRSNLVVRRREGATV